MDEKPMEEEEGLSRASTKKKKNKSPSFVGV